MGKFPELLSPTMGGHRRINRSRRYILGIPHLSRPFRVFLTSLLAGLLAVLAMAPDEARARNSRPDEGRSAAHSRIRARSGGSQSPLGLAWTGRLDMQLEELDDADPSQRTIDVSGDVATGLPDPTPHRRLVPMGTSPPPLPWGRASTRLRC